MRTDFSIIAKLLTCDHFLATRIMYLLLKNRNIITIVEVRGI